MSWWEARRLAAAIAVIDLLGLAVAVAICAAMGSTGRAEIGTAVFIAACALIFVSVGNGGGAVPISLRFLSRQDFAIAESQESEVGAIQKGRDAAEEVRRELAGSWLMVFGIAGLSLVAVSAWILLV